MGEEDKIKYIQQIRILREKNTELEKETEALRTRKDELVSISERLQSYFKDFEEQNVRKLADAQTEIRAKLLREENSIKKSYEEKLRDVIEEKQNLERRIEAESEFLSMNLRSRLSALHTKTHQLRDQLAKKSKEVAANMNRLSPNEALQASIQASNDYCAATANKIAEAHREIEGLTIMNARLEALATRFAAPLERRRRLSFGDNI